MLRGKSVHHVDQREGRIYSVSEIKGYYNDLTEKVTRFGLENDEVPMSTVDSGKQMYFPIEIFQYGLAAYDLYLLNNDESMLKKAIACGKWALDNQQENGGWITFAHKNKDHPYSSMAQGSSRRNPKEDRQPRSAEKGTPGPSCIRKVSQPFQYVRRRGGCPCEVPRHS